ncbi:uncharacterized protein LOC106712268 [Papilio machaon]|uniref:uncharacterized protein LOC106712268 n=1 Tax=Papilio machaon TaxID=76193 RepID=UPI001E663849|nr:uncharacterized protein LOC106712268 [Papilio machaon]
MRTYKRKTTRCSYTTEDLKNAVKAVNDEGKSVNAAAKKFGIKRMTLTRFLKKLNEGGDSSMGYTTPRQIFSPTQEDSLKKYLLQMASIFYGYSPKDVRRLAYECAAKFDIKIPPSWTANKMAGKEWLSMFLKRNPELSIRKPKPTSHASHPKSLNAQNVKVFFEKLAEAMDRYGFTAADIWNIDETGVSTVMKPNKIVAAKGKRNVGAMTSGERGTNVTVVTAVSALGNNVPPMFVFPRKQFKTHFLNGGPPECIGAGNASGCVTDEEFYHFMQHFIKHVKPSIERPVLLVLDNHSSHLNVKTLSLAKEKGVVMLSFPPHCSHKLQPLDVSVFGPFKKYCAAAKDAWLRNNPGKTLTIYDIPKIVADSLPFALTKINIVYGFQKTGIFPYNAHIFGEEEYSPSFVTDRSEPETIESEKDPVSSTEPYPTLCVSTSQVEPEAGPSIKKNETIDLRVFSPEIVRPYPKAGPREATKTNRRKRKAAILIDSPEKNALEE